ncbi:MAG TPA: sensor domain-containing diguanylate cyclase [Polyangiaceae bacterium]|jgi:diguanylate cyclase (GGDEF)-like protein
MSFDALKDLLVLLQLTEQLTDGRALEDALRAVTDATLSILPGDHASIRLLDASRTHLLASARSGTGHETPSVQLRADEGLSGWVLAHGEPARVVDVRKDPRFVVAPGQGFPIRSIVVEPLISEGAPMGVLAVSSPEVNAFSPTDELLARLLANCTVAPIQRARLERLAVTDDLTLAFNGRYLASRLVEEMERARRSERPLSLLLMDLDHFKLVNDSHGHAVGDQVLRAFVDRVRAATRRVDILVRRGGEEFVLVMPSTNDAHARLIADRIRVHASEQPIAVGPARVKQTVSIGVATWNGRESAEVLQRRADDAMYDAKQRGRNRVEVSVSRARRKKAAPAAPSRARRAVPAKHRSAR